MEEGFYSKNRRRHFMITSNGDLILEAWPSETSSSSLLEDDFPWALWPIFRPDVFFFRECTF